MPVLETLGGALFGAVLQVLLDKLDSRQVLDYFRGKTLNEKLLKKLKRNLMDINSVIDDAEQKQFSNSLVKAWLDDVRDALYDAEDLLEQIDYEFYKSDLEAEFQSSSSKVLSFESNMTEVIHDLESLSNQKVVQAFKISSDVGSGLGNKVSEKKIESSSLVAEEVIYGRDGDKEMILSWLTSDTNDNELSIICIVGMGGMGKTTLAQHVYNDPKIKEAKFDLKAWVCVSDEFNVLTVSKAIIGAFNKSKDDSGDLEMVHGKLEEKLRGTKFLLVLDDVWNEDKKQWKALRTPLVYGAKGSKILVTTRSNKVASIMQSSYIHQLQQLDEDYSWQVFAKHAVQDVSSELNSELKEIGMKIVEKCEGLPLALETVGGLLQSKSTVSEWEGVLKSNIWDLPKEDSEIIPALLLSYYHLPSHLKRCFAYCALFPKDHEFDKDSLILLWMAESFLQCSQQSKSPEEVGEQYFNDLLSRSFFQQITIDDAVYNKPYFVMHDLLNDLAKYVSGEMCFRLGVDRQERVPHTTRHLSYVNDPIKSKQYRSLHKAKRLRTFISICWDCKMPIQELISNFKFLRVLSMSYCHNIKEVPDTIADLIHLRSLDLSATHIKILPSSICSLCNLQVLKLNKCSFLEELPSHLHELTNLRRLELMGTNLSKAPVLLGKLKNLHIWMDEFEVDKSSEFCIQQLGELDLHGQLSIRNLENIVNPSDALAAELKRKTHLGELHLNWFWILDPDDSVKEKIRLENLQPSRHLKRLLIDGYGGTEFPRWLSDNSLLNVVSLGLMRCEYCLWLPALGLLTFLKHLKIDGLDQIVRINADFYGNSSSAFPSLETLSFSDMKEWEEWECMAGAFPNLQSLSVTNCPKLKGNLPEKLSHLKNLCIEYCERLVASIPSAVEIQNVNMEPSSFDMIGHKVYMHRNFCIEGLKKLKSLPKGMSAHLPSLNFLSICGCPEVELSEGCLPSNLKRMDLWNCSKLVASLKGAWGTNPSLKSLYIGGVDEECFVGEDLLPLSLTELVIYECSNLKKLDCKGLSYLSSLEKLVLHHCPNLQCLPEEGLPKSISELRIEECPLLKQRCKKQEGEDWEKIAHIKTIWLDYEQVIT